MPKHKPVRIFFPYGIPDALARIARKTGYSEQHSALTLWQFQSQLTHQIIERKTTKVQPTDLLVKLNIEVLRDKINDRVGTGKSSRVGPSKHLKALVDGGVLDLKVPHLAGFASRQYAYNDQYHPIGRKCEPYILDKPTVLNAFYRHRPLDAEDDSYFKKRQEYLHQLDFDSSAALEWAKQQAPTRGDDADLWLSNVVFTLDQIAAGHRRLIKDEHGREHNPFVRIPRHIRKNFITYRSEKLVQLDLPASQFMILFSKLRKGAAKQELDLFKQALQYDFYEFMAEAWQGFYGTDTKPTRSEMKGHLYLFLFGPVIWQIDIFPLFFQLFPRIYKVLEETKARDYTKIATGLQTLESRIIFGACKALTDEGLEPHMTIHDCLAVIPSHVERTDQILLAALQQEGIDWLTTLRKE